MTASHDDIGNGGRNLGEALSRIQTLSLQVQAEIDDGPLAGSATIQSALVEIATIASDMNPSVPA
jgi:hypothetical protein